MPVLGFRLLLIEFVVPSGKVYEINILFDLCKVTENERTIWKRCRMITSLQSWLFAWVFDSASKNNPFSLTVASNHIPEVSNV